MKIRYYNMLLCLSLVLAMAGVMESFAESESGIPFYHFSFCTMFLLFLSLLFVQNKKFFCDVSQVFILLILGWLVFCTFFSYLNLKIIPIATITILFNYIMLYVIAEYRFVQQDVTGILIIYGVGAVLLSVFFCLNSHFFMGYITIGTLSPQILGTWSFLFFAGLLLFCVKLKEQKSSIIFRIALSGICGYLFYIAVVSQSRLAVLCMCLYLLFHFLPRMDFLLKKEIVYLEACIPIAIVFLSFFIYDFSIGRQYYYGVSLLNGREQIWKDCLKEALSHAFTGMGWISQDIYSHNVFVDHIYLLGCPLGIVFFLILASVLKTVALNAESKFQYEAFLAFLFCLLQGANETMVFLTGSGGCYLFAFTFLLAANSCTTNKKDLFIRITI